MTTPKFSAALKALASERGKGLYHVTTETKSRAMSTDGMMDHDTAERMHDFAMNLYLGKAPGEAFALAWPDEE